MPSACARPDVAGLAPSPARTNLWSDAVRKQVRRPSRCFDFSPITSACSSPRIFFAFCLAASDIALDGRIADLLAKHGLDLNIDMKLSGRWCGDLSERL
jgi:hypothetical protein